MNSEQSLGLLNKSVADELAAVHQYMYFHFHLDDQGFAPLAKLFKRTAIAEMGHVEALAERIPLRARPGLRRALGNGRVIALRLPITGTRGSEPNPLGIIVILLAADR